MLNKQMLIGHLGADPEIQQFSDGNMCARFRLATTERSFQTARGQIVPERTTWHNCEAWGGLARVMRDRTRKGDKVYVEGIHRTREYADKDGVAQVWHSCDVTYLELLSPKDGRNADPGNMTTAPAAADYAAQPSQGEQVDWNGMQQPPAPADAKPKERGI